MSSRGGALERAYFETLESRRLFAGWSFGPGEAITEPMEKPSSGYFTYELDPMGLQWSVLTDTGTVTGRTFDLRYIESLPSHDGDVGPDLSAQLERKLQSLRAVYDHNGDVPADAIFYAQQNPDGTVSFIRSVTRVPRVEDTPGPSLPDNLHPPLRKGHGPSFDENGNQIDADHWTQKYLARSQWGGSYHIHTEDGRQFLRLIDWVGSGSIAVGFEDLTFDDLGRPVLGIVKAVPEGGTCDMKYYAYEVELPAGYEGEIVIRETIRTAQFESEALVETLPDVILTTADLLAAAEASPTDAPPADGPRVAVPSHDLPSAPPSPSSPADDAPAASLAQRAADDLFDDEADLLTTPDPIDVLD